MTQKILVGGEQWVTAGGKLKRCKGCDELIKFGRTDKNEWVAYDPETKASHWSTCKAADKYRREEDRVPVPETMTENRKKEG